MVDAILGKWGKLTIGVNNAGIGHWVRRREQWRYADWLRMIDVDLNSVFLCAQAEARIMLPAGYGKIINTASMSGHISNTPQNQSAYNTAKAGVLHLTRSLAAEWAKAGVRVNSISPGYTRTKLVDDLLATPIGQTMLPLVDGNDAHGAHGRSHRPAGRGRLPGLRSVGLYDGARYGHRWRVLRVVERMVNGQ